MSRSASVLTGLPPPSSRPFGRLTVWMVTNGGSVASWAACEPSGRTWQKRQPPPPAPPRAVEQLQTVLRGRAQLAAVERAVVRDQGRLVEHDRDAPEHGEVQLHLGKAEHRGRDQNAGIGDAEAAGRAPPFVLECPLHQVAVIVGDREAPGQGAAQIAERAGRTEHAVLRMDLLQRERPVQRAEQLAADVGEGALAARHLEIGERRPDRLRREARVGQVEGGELQAAVLQDDQAPGRVVQHVRLAEHPDAAEVVHRPPVPEVR